MGASCWRNKNGERMGIDTDVNISTVRQKENCTRSYENLRSPRHVLDDDFETEITNAVSGCIKLVRVAYQAERDRIVDEMCRLAPEPYCGLLFSDYPDKNASKVNQIARQRVTSDEAKQQHINQINENLEPSFESQTADWDSLSQENARSFITELIEKLLKKAIDRLILN